MSLFAYIAIGVAIWVAIGLIAYCACVAAGRADEQMGSK